MYSHKAHSLGFGTLWAQNNLVESTTNTNTGAIRTGANGWRYLGAEGNLGMFEISGLQQEAVVENLYGLGAARKHWKNTEYPAELMTAILGEAEEEFISLMTIRSLEDLGYQVDITQADKYGIGKKAKDMLPSGRRRLRSRRKQQQSYLSDEILELSVLEVSGIAKPNLQSKLATERKAHQDRKQPSV